MFRARRLHLVAFLGLALLAPGLLALEGGSRSDGDSVGLFDARVTASSGVEVSADLRAGYLAGQNLLVTVRVGNLQESSIEFPRLDERPWLVSFELTSADGKHQTRRTTPPDEDEDLRWVLPPRGSRQMVVEIPSGASLPPGAYQFAVHVQDGEEDIALGPVPVLLEPPAPVTADITDGDDGTNLLGWQTPWVHQGQDGYHLYLHSTPADVPGARGYQWHLAALEAPVRPWLSDSRATEGASRYLYWRDGELGLGYARLEGHGLRQEPRQVRLPWPRWELLSRGASDPAGSLHVPVWIPAPSGAAGEVRVVSIDARGQPRFRRVVGLEGVPQAATWLDGAGQLRLLLQHEDKIDLYTLSTTDSERPASGRRLAPQVQRAGVASLGAQASAPVGSGALVSDRIGGFVAARLGLLALPPVLGARFDVLPDRPDEAGGTAVFAWLGQPEGDRLQVIGVWMSLSGRVIGSVAGRVLPPEHRIVQVLPRGYDAMVLVTEDSRGGRWAHSADWDAPLALGTLGPDDALRVAPDGSLWSVRLETGRGVVAARLAP